MPTADELAELREVSSLCETTPDAALREMASVNNGEAHAGSRVAREVSSFGPQAAAGAHMSLLVLSQAAEHLQGVAALIEAKKGVWAPRPLLRAVFEYIALAYWLTEDGLDGRAMAARRLLLDAIGAAEQLRISERAPKASGLLSGAQARMAEVETRIAELGLPPIVRGKRTSTWTLDRQTYGTQNDRMRVFSRRFFPGAEAIPFYSFVSELTHPTSTSIRTLSERVDDGRALAFSTFPSPLIRGWSRTAIAGWGLSAKHLVTAMGWHPTVSLTTWLSAVQRMVDQRSEASP